VTDRESHWAALMRAAIRGDTSAYHRVLDELAPMLRGLASRGFAHHKLSPEDVEDVVQETLLALHLKRHTWDESKPLLPWVHAVARNKVVDNLRRRGRRIYLPIDDVSEWLAGEDQPTDMNNVDAEHVMGRLKGRDRVIVAAISIEGASAGEVAKRLGMTEGAVRVALHRALQSLAKIFRAGSP
jgi:RNA polymerase sigma-70 factor, ECF subfamily